MPHVDEFRPVHNLESLEAIAAALFAPSRRGHAAGQWQRAMTAA
jgi:uncharacterized protein